MNSLSGCRINSWSYPHRLFIQGCSYVPAKAVFLRRYWNRP